MSMRYTKHGRARADQRGISLRDIELVRKYGTDVRDCKNEVYLLRRKDIELALSDLKSEMQRLERMAGCTAVLSGDEVITVYRATSEVEKALLRR